MRRWADSILRAPRGYSSSPKAKPPAPRVPTAQPISTTTTTPSPPDPFALLAPQLSSLRSSLLPLLDSGHPALTKITRYYFLHPSKQIRPLIVLLFSQATNGLGRNWHTKLWAAESPGAGGRADELDRPLTRPDVLNDWNPSLPAHTAPFDPVFSLFTPHPHRPSIPAYQPPPLPPPASLPTPTPTLVSPPRVLPTQTRLAQIVELLHTASLLHDDVVDASPLRRAAPSAPAVFGSKRAVLAGNFVLGRASAALARLGDAEATDLIAGVIADLVEGEILQMRDAGGREGGEGEGGSGGDGQGGGGEAEGRAARTSKEAWALYLQKTYLKTASLMAKGARAAVTLGGCAEGDVWREIAYAYGRNLGIAFQLVDDVLDYESAAPALGKPGGADLHQGLATGPALYAWDEHPAMGALIRRKFKMPGDVELARGYVGRSKALQRTRTLAEAYADKAKEVLRQLPESKAKSALEVLAEKVVARRS